MLPTGTEDTLRRLLLPLEDARLSTFGDTAVVITLGDDIDVATHDRVRAVAQVLDAQPPDAMVEYVPAFTTVTVVYDPLATTHDAFTDELRAVLQRAPEPGAAAESRLVEVHVCYGGDFGPDLDFVAAHNDISADDVISIHSEPDYLVYMIGFAPGFPYVGGMSKRIAAPRRDSPRDRIPAGSIAIAGEQTGIYPIETPGGWQLIGRTPLRLFRPDEEDPTLLHTGDRLRFRPIARQEYDELLEREEER
jgi:inhibitor of KinA